MNLRVYDWNNVIYEIKQIYYVLNDNYKNKVVNVNIIHVDNQIYIFSCTNLIMNKNYIYECMYCCTLMPC